MGYALLSVVVWGLGLGLVADSYNRTVAAAGDSMAALAGLARGHVKAALDSIDLGVKLLAYRMTVSDWQILRNPGALADEQRAAITSLLSDIERALPVPAKFFVLGEDGTALAWASPRPLPATNFADRSDFQIHRQGGAGTVYLSTPQGPPLFPDHGFTVTRRIESSANAFAGVVGAAMVPRVFDPAFASLDIRPGAVLTVATTDGRPLLRYPAASPAAGDGAETGPETGPETGLETGAGTGAISAAHGLPRYGLTVVASEPVASATADWRRQTTAILAAAFIVYLLLTAAVLVGAKEMTAARQASAAAQTSEARLRTFFDATFEGIVVSDRGSIIDVNDALIAMTGYQPETLIGTPLTHYVHEDDVEEVAEAVRRARAEPYRVRIRRADGTVFVAEARGQSDPSRPGVRLTAIRDLTHLLDQEQRLRHLVWNLERSNQDLEQFAYIASHDLQEPLRTVSSYVGLIARRYGGALDNDGKEFVDFAVGGVYRMQALIRDLLDYSRIGTRGIEPTPSPLAALVEEASTALTAAIRETGAVIEVEPLPTAMADPRQIARVFQNLLSNAIKYRQPDAPPRIRVGAKRLSDAAGPSGFWRVTVSDNGLGIAPDHADQVFLIFQRLHGQGTYDGTGIGLAIARRIVERHGGRIWIDTARGEGQGTAVHFTLPTVAEDLAREPSSGGDDAAASVLSAAH
jgi:PAS domain S-box-containing protein